MGDGEGGVLGVACWACGLDWGLGVGLHVGLQLGLRVGCWVGGGRSWVAAATS